MRALERLKASVAMKPTRKAVALPDGSEFEFYSAPVTLAERARAQKQAGNDDAVSFALQLLVSKAVDENGQKLFAPGEIAELRHELPAAVVEALMLQLLQEGDLDEDEPADPKPSAPNSKRTTS
jgi:capsid protein